MTRPHAITFDWESSPRGLPQFQRIAVSIARTIRSGRLLPGAELPSSRRLATQLGVHRNTVLAAYRELEVQGYLCTRPARGTFVSTELPPRPTSETPRHEVTDPVAFPMVRPPAGLVWGDRFEPPDPRSNVLALVAGMPDLRQLPIPAIRRAYRGALGRPEALDYGSDIGHPRLLEALGTFLADSRGVLAGPGELIVTRGSQHALHLAAGVLVPSGEVVAVENLGYRPAWNAFRLAGAELAPLRVDAEGVVVDDLARLCERRRVRAVYLTPHHQYPTTVTLSGRRRMELVALAIARGICVIEDDYDHEFHFEGRPVLPLASNDPRRVVLHVGTLSKVLAPGLRLGYAVGQPQIIEAMAARRRFLDRQGDHVGELALAQLIEDGELAAHIRRMHRTYAQRRDVLAEQLTRRLGSVVQFDLAPGGLGVWTRVPDDVSPELWAERAAGAGLLIHAGGRFAFDPGPTPFLRLGFARLDPDELRRAVTLLARTLPARRSIERPKPRRR